MADPGQESTPYVDAMLAYAEREPGRFQVPGHKGGAGAGSGAQLTTLRGGSPTLFERRTQHTHSCVRYGQRDATRPRAPRTARYRFRDPTISVLRLVPMYNTQV